MHINVLRPLQGASASAEWRETWAALVTKKEAQRRRADLAGVTTHEAEPGGTDRWLSQSTSSRVSRRPWGTRTRVEVTDLTGTKDHYKAVVVSEAFDGSLPIKRHRLVYGALEEEMKGPIHALTLETYTPAEWDRSS